MKMSLLNFCLFKQIAFRARVNLRRRTNTTNLSHEIIRAGRFYENYFLKVNIRFFLMLLFQNNNWRQTSDGDERKELEDSLVKLG
jgi:hypothetical protein